MIELIIDDRCVKCDVCVDVCPTRVFNAVEGGVPVIARQDDCQTCFMCEAYCPVDAMYVSPEAEHTVSPNVAELIERGVIGSYRRNLGWSKDARETHFGASSYVVLDRYFSDTL